MKTELIIAIISGLALVVGVIVYPRAWAFIQSYKEDDSDLNT